MITLHIGFVVIASYFATFAAKKFITNEVISSLIEESTKLTVNFINCDEEMMESFLQSQNFHVAVEIENFQRVIKRRKRKIEATITIIKSLADFEIFYSLINNENFHYNGHFIILFKNATASDMEKIFSKFWKIYIYNVNILTIHTNNSEIISMYTFMPFINDFSCDNVKPVKINEFNRKSSQWQSNKFFPNKFKNLHGCELKIGSFENRPGFFTKKIKNEISLTGIDVEIITAMHKILNFQPIYKTYPTITGAIFKNKTSTGLLKRVYENEVDVIIGTLSLQQSRTEHLSETHMIYTDKLILVIPPPFLINSLVKIVLPFHIYTWLSVIIIVLFACAVIIMLKFTPRVCHNYIIGNNVNRNVFNVWAILLGVSQRTVPKTNFPRFLLAKFLIFALVIRSLYQGAIFDILKNDINTVELKSIDDLIEHKFTFYVYDSLAARLNGTKIIERHKVISLSEINATELLTLNPSFKGGVFDYLSIVLYNNFLNRKNFTLKICKEALLTNQIVFYFTKNFYLVDEFNDLIGNLKSAGLIDYSILKYVDMNLIDSHMTKKLPSALTFENLKGIFQLLIYGLGGSFTIFLLEVLIDLFKRMKNFATRISSEIK